MAIDNNDINPKNQRMGEEDMDIEISKWPKWLKPVLTEKFFGHCKNHIDSHKSECNMYCLDCISGSLCSLCTGHHKEHHVIQIRRSSYHDVIRVSEIQKVLDITGVQTYIINSARVVFLNERPQPRPGKGVTNTCEVCERSLLDTFKFCSLGCKIVGTSRSFKKEVRRPYMGRSDSEESYSATTNTTSHPNNRAMAPAGPVQMENLQCFSPSTPPPTAVVSFRTSKRRKGIPHHAPLGGGLMV